MSEKNRQALAAEMFETIIQLVPQVIKLLEIRARVKKEQQEEARLEHILMAYEIGEATYPPEDDAGWQILSEPKISPRGTLMVVWSRQVERYADPALSEGEGEGGMPN